ncbi:MAG: hypothetical protein HQK96_20650 [Nitrospirae bacterium]|nr:hypothetical protein [Nitrospirota bacterium]
MACDRKNYMIQALATFIRVLDEDVDKRLEEKRHKIAVDFDDKVGALAFDSAKKMGYRVSREDEKRLERGLSKVLIPWFGKLKER